jgi:hypothetical protein
METQWFPASKVQDAEVIKQGFGVCLLGQNGILLLDYLQKGATITAKCYVALPDKLKKQLVSKGRGSALPHKAAITHQKLAHLRFEVP